MDKKKIEIAVEVLKFWEMMELLNQPNISNKYSKITSTESLSL